MDTEEEVQKKLICGYLHYKVPCWICRELIWTQHPVGNICNQCIDLDMPHCGNPHPSTPYSEVSYNGNVEG